MNNVPSPLMELEAEMNRLAELRRAHRRQQLQPLASGPTFRQSVGRMMIRAGESIAGSPRTRR